LNDLNVNYAKQLEKQQQQTNTGYHTPPPAQSTYSNPLINQGNGAGQQPYAYIPQQMIGQHQHQHQPGGTPLVLPGMQDNSRVAGLSNPNVKQQQQQQLQNKSAYPANSWS
jgi:hypothetical protein